MASAFPRLAALADQHRSVLWGLSRAGRPGAAALCTFEGGVETIPLALARALGPSLRLGARVTALRRDAGWRVSVTQASGTEELTARRVVLSVSAPAAAELATPPAPPSVATGNPGGPDSVESASLARTGSSGSRRPVELVRRTGHCRLQPRRR